MILINNEFNFNLYSVVNCVHNSWFGPGRQRHHVFHYVESGKGVFIINEKKYAISAGDCFYFSSANIVEYYSDEKDPWTYSWFTAGGNIIEEFFEKCGFSAENDVIHLNDDTAVKKLFKLLCEDESYQTYGNFFFLMDELIKQSDRRILLEKSVDYVDVAKKFIRENYHRKIYITEICKMLNLERSYLCRLFKAKTNHSPQQYILNYKMEKAHALLRTQNMTVLQAARSVGYEDQAAFSKLFKNFYGYNPKDVKSVK